MSAIYKSGQEAKAGDSVSGPVKGAEVRGRVVRVDAKKGVVLLERRAPFVVGKPLGVMHDESEAAVLTLVYRHVRGAGQLAPSPSVPPAVVPAKVAGKSRGRG